jgi:penicillin-binding protein 2
MFQRRLRIILVLLIMVTAVLVARAFQVQILQRADWQASAADMMKRTDFIETTRGNIVDFKNRVLALDEPCTDACVDYRVITDDPDPAFVAAEADKRAVKMDDYAHLSTAKKHQRIDEQSDQVRRDILSMWSTLAHISGKTSDEIDDIRRSIVQRVETRRRYLWYVTYQLALRKRADDPKPPWYESWLQGGSGDAPNLDDYAITVGEQTEPHVILNALNPDTVNLLEKNLERFPGLVLRPGQHRVYPFGQAVCHTIGHLSPVDIYDRNSDPFKDDELRKYLLNDVIGHGGIEGLCEQALRGIRGQTVQYANSDQVLTTDPRPGRDVRITLDVELQTDVEEAFAKRRVYPQPDPAPPVIRENQHGAAVVIDIATGQVRAMVSYPGFDPNSLDTDYPVLARDDLNTPLLNRATQAQLEPGSTAKTMVGLGAITHGFATPTSTIECTGYLVINGIKYNVGKCWVATQYESLLGRSGVAHHPVPESAPHPTEGKGSIPGKFAGTVPGFLTVTDALERSCNVQFETLADRMGLTELQYWFDQFGLGRPTGVGITESSGHIPNPANIPAALRQYSTWFAGIGQGEVRATPIQMANVAATIARNGIWMRPRLLVDPNDAATKPSTPDTVDLHLAPDALEAVRLGMVRVVNSPAGTGTQVQKHDGDSLSGILVAGKTGSAQAAKLTVPVRDSAGAIVMENGHAKHQIVELGTPGTQTWYVGVGDNNDKVVHAWFIGFAPADKPQIAFCVMVEYGGSGGIAADIAHDVLTACIDHGYLSKSSGPEALRLEQIGAVSAQPDFNAPDPDAPDNLAAGPVVLGPPAPVQGPPESSTPQPPASDATRPELLTNSPSRSPEFMTPSPNPPPGPP